MTENAAKWVPYYYADLDSVVLVDDNGPLLSGCWRVAHTDDPVRAERDRSDSDRCAASWIVHNLQRVDLLPRDHKHHRCDGCATGHGSVNAYETPPARILVGDGDAATPAYGCPRHPQSRDWALDVVIDGDTWPLDCCAICGTPFDAKAREALAKQQPEGPVIRTFSVYREWAARTDKDREWSYYSGSLCEEAGEVWGVLKKVFDHGHELVREKLVKELGDVLWHVDRLAAKFGITLEEVASANAKKLAARYPGGYSDEKSRNREAAE